VCFVVVIGLGAEDTHARRRQGHLNTIDFIGENGPLELVIHSGYPDHSGGIDRGKGSRIPIAVASCRHDNSPLIGRVAHRFAVGPLPRLRTETTQRQGQDVGPLIHGRDDAIDNILLGTAATSPQHFHAGYPEKITRPRVGGHSYPVVGHCTRNARTMGTVPLGVVIVFLTNGKEIRGQVFVLGIYAGIENSDQGPLLGFHLPRRPPWGRPPLIVYST
jgi:hypothetical protein